MTITNSDAYKVSHKGFMVEGTELIYSNLTPRSSKYLPVLKNNFDDKITFFGLQYFIKDYLIDEWNTKFFNKPKGQVIGKYKRIFDNYLGKDSVDMKHFEDLHDLGYLPLHIKALPEGSAVDIKVPFLTIYNTDKKYAWLTNYLETVLSCELWKPCTVATIIKEYRKLANKFAMKTSGTLEGTEFQIHGFEFRGMSGRKDAAICAAAFLLSSNGTDTIPVIELLEDYYNADGDNEFIAASVPASEHSLASAGIAAIGELETYRKWITKDYPTGIVSIIADTLDFFRVVTEFAEELKDDILNRQTNELGLAKTVFRPDSGCPVDILCGKDFNTITDSYYLDALAKEDVDKLTLWKRFVAEEVDEIFRDNLDAENPHYSEETEWGYDGKVYTVTYEPDLNRHDKTYYFVENYGSTLSKCTFTERVMTPEDKGAVQCLWDIFGGTETKQGYKLLHERVGLIYGDSITLERAEKIFERLAHKGFASMNVVFGVGSFTSQMITRDSTGTAMKAVYSEINGKGYELSKDPKTDDGTKKSAKGLLQVTKDAEGNFKLKDQCTWEEEGQGELQTVFLDGELTHETSLSEIRERVQRTIS